MAETELSAAWQTITRSYRRRRSLWNLKTGSTSSFPRFVEEGGSGLENQMHRRYGLQKLLVLPLELLTALRVSLENGL